MNDAVSHLEKIASLAPVKKPTNPSDIQETQFVYCYSQLHYMLVLANSFAGLVERREILSCQIVARTILESLFKFASAKSSSVVCLQLIYSDAFEEVDKIEKYTRQDPSYDKGLDIVLDRVRAERDLIATLHPDAGKRINLFNALPREIYRLLYRLCYCLLYTSPSPRDRG